MVKNPLANVGDLRDVDSIAISGRSAGEVHGNPLELFLPGEFLRAEEFGKLQSIGSQKVGHD